MTGWLLDLAPTVPAAPLSGWSIFSIITSGVAALSVLGTFLYVRETKRKIAAEAKKLEVEPEVLLSQSAMEMLREARIDAKSARSEAKESKAYANALAAHVVELETVLRGHGITPPPFRWPPIGLVSDDSA